jgi:hypothetical protein
MTTKRCRCPKKEKGLIAIINTCLILKDAVKSVLRISSAHKKGEPADINIAQILHLSNFFELKRLVYLYSFTSIANQKSVRYSVNISYFTNIAVQNVNKAFVHITEFTASFQL